MVDPTEYSPTTSERGRWNTVSAAAASIHAGFSLREGEGEVLPLTVELPPNLSQLPFKISYRENSCLPVNTNE